MFSLSSLGLKATDIKILLSMYFIIAIVSFLIMCTLYIVKSVGLYYMAEQIGLNKKWYVFFPFFSDVKLSELSHLNNGGKKSNALSVIHIFLSIFAVIGLASFAVGFVDTVFIADKALLNGKAYDTSAIEPLIIPAIIVLIGSVLRIIYAVLFYICIYKTFKIFSLNQAVVYTVLSILFPILLPFFILSASKNKPIFVNKYNQSGNI